MCPAYDFYESMRKLRFSVPLGAKVGCHWPAGSARAQG